MRAAVLERFGAPYVIDDIDLRALGPTEVVVSTTAAPYCITDCTNRRGELGKEPPTILGHAGVGTVTAIGDAVRRVAVGDRVLAPGTPECGTCRACARGRPDMCSGLFEPPAVIGTRPDGGSVTCTGVGSYAQAMLLREIAVFPLSSSLDDDVLSLLGCGITSGMGAVLNIARIEPGATVAINGCGHIGLWMVQAARVAGASRIIAVEPIAARRDLAVGLGATHTVDPSADDPVAAVKGLTGGHGVDASFEAAGRIDAMVRAFHMAAFTGVVVLTGVERGDSTITLPALELVVRGRDVRACQNGRVRFFHDTPRFVDMLERGTITTEGIITSRYGIDQANDADAAAAEHRDVTGLLTF